MPTISGRSFTLDDYRALAASKTPHIKAFAERIAAAVAGDPDYAAWHP